MKSNDGHNAGKAWLKPLPDTPGQVEVRPPQALHKGFFAVDRVELRHELFRGGWSPWMTRELFVRGDAVCVLPYDPWRDAVVLGEQFRIGALGRDHSPWLLEIVAGMQEDGEDPEQVAVREAGEEAGLEILSLREICRYHPSPGGSTEFIYLYLGIVHAPGAGGIYGLDEEAEDIRTHVMPRAGLEQAFEQGQVVNAATIIALQWLRLHAEALRSEWCRTSP